MDKEYLVLDNIDKNSNITQRELAKKTGLSLGSVNILLNKMTREGLIKIEQIPMNRVMYMLTPKGMLEKINKTYNYIRIHYKYISDTKDKIKSSLLDILSSEGKIHVILENDEISVLTKSSIEELGNANISYSNRTESIPEMKTLVVLNNESYDHFDSSFYKIINLLEHIS